VDLGFRVLGDPFQKLVKIPLLNPYIGVVQGQHLQKYWIELLNILKKIKNIHKSWTSKSQSSSGSQQQAAHTTLLCFQQEP